MQVLVEVIVENSASRPAQEQVKLVEEQIGAVKRYIQAIKEAEPSGDGPLTLELELLHCIEEEYRLMIENLNTAA